jgi:hypothetical protein
MQPVKRTIPHSVYHLLLRAFRCSCGGITDIASRITILQIPPHFRVVIPSAVRGVDSMLYTEYLDVQLSPDHQEYCMSVQAHGSKHAPVSQDATVR